MNNPTVLYGGIPVKLSEMLADLVERGGYDGMEAYLMGFDLHAAIQAAEGREP